MGSLLRTILGTAFGGLEAFGDLCRPWSQPKSGPTPSSKGFRV